MTRLEFPAKVRDQAAERAAGKCENPKCGAVLGKKRKHFDHILPDALGGKPTIANCQVLCEGDYPGLDIGRKSFYRWARQAGAVLAFVIIFGVAVLNEVTVVRAEAPARASFVVSGEWPAIRNLDPEKEITPVLNDGNRTKDVLSDVDGRPEIFGSPVFRQISSKAHSFLTWLQHGRQVQPEILIGAERLFGRVTLGKSGGDIRNDCGRLPIVRGAVFEKDAHLGLLVTVTHFKELKVENEHPRALDLCQNISSDVRLCDASIRCDQSCLGGHFGVVKAFSNQPKLEIEKADLAAPDDDQKESKETGGVVRQPVPKAFFLLCLFGGVFGCFATYAFCRLTLRLAAYRATAPSSGQEAVRERIAYVLFEVDYGYVPYSRPEPVWSESDSTNLKRYFKRADALIRAGVILPGDGARASDDEVNEVERVAQAGSVGPSFLRIVTRLRSAERALADANARAIEAVSKLKLPHNCAYNLTLDDAINAIRALTVSR